MRNKFNSESGQIGVIILLTMAGMLTMGLSLASRTTQEALLSGKEAESARVFNAAEQGVEEALSSELASLDFTDNIYSDSISSVTGVDVNFTIEKVNALETRLFEGISVGVDVTGAETGDNLRIDWSELDDCNSENPASLVVAIYFDDAGKTRVRYEALGACDVGDGFTLASVIDVDGYKRRYDLPLETNDFLVRIKSVYNDAHIKVSSTDFTMPVQYYAIRSEAANPDSNETRIVEVNRTTAAAPSILDYAVYSGGSLSK